MDKLKPCPFCGSVDLTNNGHFVECDDCGAQGPCTYPIPNEGIIEAWNRRADKSEQGEEKK